MRKLLKFLYETFVKHEKNRHDIFDYTRALFFISCTIFIAWMIAFYGLKLR